LESIILVILKIQGEGGKHKGAGRYYWICSKYFGLLFLGHWLILPTPPYLLLSPP